MMVCQGEGVELDTQRRRHPVWEFLFSHPVSPGAVFLAEMLSPIAANPIYVTAPLFVAILYGNVYGFAWGVLAGCLVGLPVIRCGRLPRQGARRSRSCFAFPRAAAAR